MSRSFLVNDGSEVGGEPKSARICTIVVFVYLATILFPLLFMLFFLGTTIIGELYTPHFMFVILLVGEAREKNICLFSIYFVYLRL